MLFKSSTNKGEIMFSKKRLNLDELEILFTEWDRRYRNNPEKFMNEVEHLLKNTASSYGKGAALYFNKLTQEMFPKEGGFKK
jgi:hypothetical protein